MKFGGVGGQGGGEYDYNTLHTCMKFSKNSSKLYNIGKKRTVENIMNCRLVRVL